MIICVLKTRVKYIMNKKDNLIYDNLYYIKCVFKLIFFLL